MATSSVITSIFFLDVSTISCALRSKRPRSSSSVAILKPAKAPAATVVANAIAVIILFLIVASLIKLNHFTKNTRELFLVFKLNLNLILSTRALHTHVGIKYLAKHTGSLFKRLRRCRPRRLRRLSGRKQWSKIFCRSYGKALCNNLFCKSNSSILIGNCKNRTCMTSSKFTLKNHLLNYFREIKKAQRICNCRA